MKTKELKRLAQRIAKLESTLEQTSDPEVIRQTQNEIMELSSRISDPEDLFKIDEFVQEILENENS